MSKLNCYVVFIFCFLTSCISDLDFEQSKNFKSESVWSVALINLDIQSSGFLDSQSNEILQHKDSVSTTFLDNSVLQENLVKAEINLAFDNQFNRDFIVDILFLDASRNITYQISNINVLANTSNFIHQEIIEIASNRSFLQSSKMLYHLNLQPSSNGSVIDLNLIKHFKVNSDGKFYLEID